MVSLWSLLTALSSYISSSLHDAYHDVFHERHCVDNQREHCFMSFRNVSNYKATIEQATRRYITNNQERETEGTFMKKRVNKWTSRRYKREEESLTVKRPRSVHTTFKGPPGGPFVLIDAALDDVDIANLQILGDAVHTNMQHINFASNRPLYGSSAEAGGGNNVTFITGFLQYTHPELTQHLWDIAYSALAATDIPLVEEPVYMRNIELLEYTGGSRLTWHRDPGSAYTMILYFSTPDVDFTGGDLKISAENTLDPEAYYQVHSRRGSGVLFRSDVQHMVMPILSGVRNVLALELWCGFETVIGHLRPDMDQYYPLDSTLFVDNRNELDEADIEL